MPLDEAKQRRLADMPQIPEDYAMRPRQEQRMIESAIMGTLTDVLKDARSVANNNMLASAVAKRRGFDHLALLGEMMQIVAPQIVKYVQSDPEDEIESSIPMPKRDGKIKTGSGGAKKRVRLAAAFAKVLRDYSTVADSLGKMPGGLELERPENPKAVKAYTVDDDDELKGFQNQS